MSELSLCGGREKVVLARSRVQPSGQIKTPELGVPIELGFFFGLISNQEKERERGRERETESEGEGERERGRSIPYGNN